MKDIVERHIYTNEIGALFMACPASLASMAALAVQLWELVACFADEVDYLWIGKIKSVKLIYACSRYVLLLGQIANQALSARFYFQLEQEMAYQNICPGIFIYQSIFTQIGMVLLEMILFLRVYALYNRNSETRWSLLMVFLVSVALELCGTWIFIKSVWKTLGCDSLRVDHISIIFFGSGVGVSQVVLVLATLIKLISKRRLRGLRTPLTSMMLHQGLVTFFLVLALVAVLMIYNSISKLDMGAGNALVSWYNAFLSIGTSRLVLEMRKLPLPGADEHGMETEYPEEVNSVNLTAFNDSSYTTATSSAHQARVEEVE